MKYEMPGKIRFSETDQDGVLTLFHLVNYFQDCSTFHGEASGRGLAWSREKHLAWILAAWQIHVRSLPRLGDEVLVKTWPNMFRGFMAGRNFTMETPEGALLASADSEWVLMDMEKNRPVRTEKNLMEIFHAGGEEKLQEEFGGRKVILPERGEEKEPFRIQEFHLDTNHHVNNAQYVRMAEQYLEEGFRTVHFRGDYKKQAYLGSLVVPRVLEVENGTMVSLDSEEGEAYFTAEFLRI